MPFLTLEHQRLLHNIRLLYFQCIHKVVFEPSEQSNAVLDLFKITAFLKRRKRLTGRNYPVFIDNMESVDDLANVRPTGQIIMAKCVHGAALSVRPMNQTQMPKAA